MTTGNASPLRAWANRKNNTAPSLSTQGGKQAHERKQAHEQGTLPLLIFAALVVFCLWCLANPEKGPSAFAKPVNSQTVENQAVENQAVEKQAARNQAATGHAAVGAVRNQAMTNQQMAPPPVVTHPLAVAKQPKAANATTTSLPATAPIQVYSLTEVAHATLQHYFFQQQNEKSTSHKEPKAATNWQTFPQRFVAPDLLKQTGGVFVTFSHNGQSRACWGTVFPEHADLITATVEATLGALTQEYRYPPIRASEVETLQVQVTVVRAVEAIRNIREQNPFRDGLMVRAGGKSGVILPGEATDAHTQLIQACLKAGIGPSDTYQLYRIIADVYR